MNLDHIREHVPNIRHDGVDLRRIARDVGHEMPRRRHGILRAFRDIVAPCVKEPHPGLAAELDEGPDEFVRGFLAALVELTAAYEDADNLLSNAPTYAPARWNRYHAGTNELVQDALSADRHLTEEMP